jgi:DNA-binding NarL/FixJ family response regulator
MELDLSMPILVVDDYNTMIRIIRNLLKQLGFEDVDDASDGSSALSKMRSKRYGLVIRLEHGADDRLLPAGLVRRLTRANLSEPFYRGNSAAMLPPRVPTQTALNIR